MKLQSFHAVLSYLDSLRGGKITCSYQGLAFSSMNYLIFFFHIAIFAHIFCIFHPSPNLLEITIQVLGEGGRKKTLLLIRLKIETENEVELALSVQQT